MKAVLHKSRRKAKAVAIDKKYLSLNDVNKLYERAKNRASLACFIAVITASRIDSIINCRFKIKEHNDTSFQVQFVTTKTVAHNILVANRFKELFKRYIVSAQKISYKDILTYCKENYYTGTHILRRSSAYLLEASKKFSSDDIRLYGNWSMTKNTLATAYLRDNTYQRISEFWKEAIRE